MNLVTQKPYMPHPINSLYLYLFPFPSLLDRHIHSHAGACMQIHIHSYIPTFHILPAYSRTWAPYDYV